MDELRPPWLSLSPVDHWLESWRQRAPKSSVLMLSLDHD